jgi:hypothetical protein
MDPDESMPVPMVFPHAVAASTAGPKIFQLSPLPGNIYESDCFYYANLPDITQRGFAALLACATQHGHLIIVHDCPDLVAFQVAYPLAIVCPFLEILPTIL